MNLALGLGSFTMGDCGGGATILGGYAVVAGLIVYETQGLAYDDSAAGIPGTIGLGVAGLTVAYGFIRPFIFKRSGKAAAVMDRTKIDVAPTPRSAVPSVGGLPSVGGVPSVDGLRMSYTFSF
jgi:hypothetical protein